jgi:hypothetical protein
VLIFCKMFILNIVASEIPETTITYGKKKITSRYSKVGCFSFLFLSRFYLRNFNELKNFKYLEASNAYYIYMYICIHIHIYMYIHINRISLENESSSYYNILEFYIFKNIIESTT